jgi:hypothetical protein
MDTQMYVRLPSKLIWRDIMPLMTFSVPRIRFGGETEARPTMLESVRGGLGVSANTDKAGEAKVKAIDLTIEC